MTYDDFLMALFHAPHSMACSMMERKALEAMGFRIGARDPRMNTAFEGAFMVAEGYEDGHTQEDGQGGVWCVVGDDLEQLIETAAGFFDDLEGML